MIHFIISRPVIAFTIKCNANNNGRDPLFCPFPALMTPFPVIAFITEEATGCINEEAIGAVNEAAIGAIIPQEMRLLVFLFHVSLFQSHQQLADLIFLVTLRF